MEIFFFKIHIIVLDAIVVVVYFFFFFQTYDVQFSAKSRTIQSMARMSLTFSLNKILCFCYFCFLFSLLCSYCYCCCVVVLELNSVQFTSHELKTSSLRNFSYGYFYDFYVIITEIIQMGISSSSSWSCSF